MNKFLILILVSGISLAQTYDAAGYKWFRGIQNKGSILSDNYTEVVVRDNVTGQYGHVLKSSFGGGGSITPTFQQVLNTGNIVNISQTSGVKAFEITSPNTAMSFFGDNILVSNATQQFNTGLNGFLFKLNDNTRRIKFDLDGIEIKTGATAAVGNINTNNLTGLRTYQFEDRTGTLAVINKATLDAYISPRIQPNEDALGWHVTKSINKVVGFSAENTDDTSNAAMANITLRGSGAIYTNNTGLSHFGANYFVSYLRSSGALYSDKNLNIVGSGATSIIDLRTGTSLATATSKLKIANDGKITIGVEPISSSSESKLLTYSTGGEIAIINKSDIVGSMPTVANSDSLPLNSNVPVGKIYYVTNTGQTYINNGILWLGL